MAGKTRMPIPWDWNGVDWKCWSVEWPDSPLWNAILNGFITTPERGWFWDERTGTVTDAMEIGEEIATRNLYQEEVLMTCNTESIALFTRMAEALEALAEKPCCPPGGGSTGSRGTGTSQEPENPYDEGTSEGEPPPGFEDMEEFNSHRCNAAQDLINNLGSDLQGLAGIEYSATSPSGLAAILIGFLLTPIPFDDIIGIAGFLIFTGYNYALLSEMSAQIAEENENLLCLLYNADNVETAKSDFFGQLETIANDTFTSPSDAEWVISACDWFITNDAFNKLFEPGPTVSQSADCSSCEETISLMVPNEGLCIMIYEGSFEEDEPTTVQSCGGIIFGDTRATMAIWSNPGGVSGPNRRVRIDAIDAASADVYMEYYVDGVSSGYDTYSEAEMLAFDEEVNAINITRPGPGDLTAFEITFRVNEIP